MPWKEVTKMKLKREFIEFAKQDGVNFAELCKRYKISRTYGYELKNKYDQEGEEVFKERSKRPKVSPTKTCQKIEESILEVREAHLSWGGRKIYHYLKQEGQKEIPHPNTITDILRRAGRLYEWKVGGMKKRCHRFEMERANELWQMDFKGHFPLGDRECHPLTVLDDYSRYAIVLEACANERQEIVKEHLIKAFRRYGLPERINVDNGSPWGSSQLIYATQLQVWLMRLGIRLSHSRPFHPETNGKDERFHRTLKEEVLNLYTLMTLEESQEYFDRFREDYNTKRPHEALHYEVPATRYQMSPRPYPEKLLPINYPSGDKVYQVNKQSGCIVFRQKQIYVGYAFKGEPVSLRPTKIDGVFNIFYCQQKIKEIDFREAEK